MHGSRKSNSVGASGGHDGRRLAVVKTDARGCQRNVGSGGAKTQARTMLGARGSSVPAARRSLAIVPQIWETMIRMSRTGCRVVWAICGIVLGVAGCCGGGPNHKCDFTPP